MSYKNAQKIMLWLLLAMVVCAILAVPLGSVMIYVTIALIIAETVIGFMFYKCPHCGAYLGHNVGRRCAKCGKLLDAGPDAEDTKENDPEKRD